MSNEPQAGATYTVVRKRRTRRHRRNRFIRRALLVVACAGLTVACASLCLRYLSPSMFRAARVQEPSRESAETSRNLLLATQQQVLRDLENRPVYKYSVIPGGVRSVRELKWYADHDPVVKVHYAGFDYDHARMVKLVLAQTAFVSYRIGNKVYWTRHRISLKKGETVITDGKMTARTRCANRVEQVPQQATSESEPPAEKFEEPVQPEKGTAMNAPPAPFQSALMNRNPAPGFGPAPPLSSLDPITGGSVTPFLPPPLPGVCGIVTNKKPVEGTVAEAANQKKKKTADPCGSAGGGGGVVPEPGTWLLMVTGAAGVFWKARHKLSRLRSTQLE